MHLFDTHVHLDDARFDEDREQVLLRMKQAGVRLCVTIGADIATSTAAKAIAEANDGVFFAAGVHPHEAKSWTAADVSTLADLLSSPKAVALGEIGLDYHYDFSPREQQKAAFERQLYEAYRLEKPAVLHVREAHGDTLDLLRARRQNLPRMVVHCYSGSWESAKAYMDLGCMISFAGSVTFKNAAKLQEVARKLPADRLLIETDCPYLAPVPVRGKRNEPAYVAHIAQMLADLRAEQVDALARQTYDNGVRFFCIAQGE